jgi:hypothetical protein
VGAIKIVMVMPRRAAAVAREPRGTTVDVPVLYINLKRSPERRERMEEHLASLGGVSYEQ